MKYFNQITYSLALCAATLVGLVNLEAFPMPCLPHEVTLEQFSENERAFNERWKAFAHNRKFTKWHQGFSEDEVLHEFQAIHRTRLEQHYEVIDAVSLISKKDYIIAQDLLTQQAYRWPHTLVFQYNKSTGLYNLSNINIEGHRFLAMEGPTEHNLDIFFKYLSTTILLN